MISTGGKVTNRPKTTVVAAYIKYNGGTEVQLVKIWLKCILNQILRPSEFYPFVVKIPNLSHSPLRNSTDRISDYIVSLLSPQRIFTKENGTIVSFPNV